jgi:hypothetical protein
MMSVVNGAAETAPIADTNNNANQSTVIIESAEAPTTTTAASLGAQVCLSCVSVFLIWLFPAIHDYRDMLYYSADAFHDRQRLSAANVGGVVGVAAVPDRARTGRIRLWRLWVC